MFFPCSFPMFYEHFSCIGNVCSNVKFHHCIASYSALGDQGDQGALGKDWRGEGKAFPHRFAARLSSRRD